MKIEIITKTGGNKKSKVFKTSNPDHMHKIFAYMKYYAAQEVIGDIDLSTDIKFKADGKKVTISELKKIIEKYTKPVDNSDTKKKDKKNDKKKKSSDKNKKKNKPGKDKKDKSKKKKKDKVLVMHYNRKDTK